MKSVRIAARAARPLGDLAARDPDGADDVRSLLTLGAVRGICQLGQLADVVPQVGGLYYVRFRTSRMVMAEDDREIRLLDLWER